MLNKIFFVFIGLFFMTGCASIDHKSMSACNGTEGLFVEPSAAGNAPYGTIESINMGNYGSSDWHAVITHVDCQKIKLPYQVLRLPPGKHSVRVKFDENVADNLLALSFKSTSFDNSAQWIDVEITQNKKYALHVKTLMYWDMAFWVMADDGQVIAHTENFKPSFIDK